MIGLIENTLVFFMYIINALLVLTFVFIQEKHIILAYMLIFFLQGTQDIDNTAQTSMLPEIVNKKDLVVANSTFDFIGNITMLIGPGLGAILYKYFGSSVLYILDSVSFLIAVFCIALIQYNYVKKTDMEIKFTLFQYAKEGFRQIKKNYFLIGILIVMMGHAILGRFYEIYKIYVVDYRLSMQVENIVYFNYAMAIGSLITPFLTGGLGERIKSWKAFSLVSILSICSLNVCGYASKMSICFIMTVCFSILNSFVGIAFRTIYQTEIENQYLGRAMACYKIFTVLSAMVGIILAPVLLNLVGMSLAFTITG
ncbi:MAG: MFS transporter, partial [bacterium]|nr:MFS transporter [bacterium]